MSAPPTRAGEDPALHALYDSLARFEWWRRRLRGARVGSGLELHKRLVAGDGPAAGAAGMHDWLWQQLRPGPAPRVLDVGCGFGASLLHWAQRHEGEFVGLGASEFQLRRARAQAAGLRLDDRCTFRQWHFGSPIDAAVGTGFHVAVSVEALFHATDLGATLREIAAVVAPGGQLAVVEDMATDAAAQRAPAAASLLAAWSSPAFRSVDEWRSALDDAGFALREQIDLSAQVPARPAATRQRADHRLRRARAVLPWPAARRVLDAFRGGMALEELYADGAARYIALIAARRPGEAGE